MNFLLIMFPSLANHVTEIKLTLVALVGAGAFLAQQVTDVKGIAELGLNGVCILAVIALGKLFLDERAKAAADREASATKIEHLQEAHKAEIREIWAEHNKKHDEREDTLKEAINENTKATGELIRLNAEQNDFNRLVGRRLMESQIPKPNLPGASTAPASGT